MTTIEQSSDCFAVLCCISGWIQEHIQGLKMMSKNEVTGIRQVYTWSTHGDKGAFHRTPEESQLNQCLRNRLCSHRFLRKIPEGFCEELYHSKMFVQVYVACESYCSPPVIYTSIYIWSHNIGMVLYDYIKSRNYTLKKIDNIAFSNMGLICFIWQSPVKSIFAQIV